MAETDEFQTNFEGLLPFPDDVPQVPLLRLSLQKLIDNDATEVNRLWEATTNIGFFYLDLRHASAQSNANGNGHVNGHANGTTTTGPKLDGDRFISDAFDLFGVSDEIFDLSVDEKVKYDFRDDGSYFGYKGYGVGVIDKDGTKDRNEFYNISKDDILGISDPLPAPDAAKKHYPLVKSYITNAHSIVTLLLHHLNTLLGLPSTNDPGATLPSLHRLSTISGDQVRVIRAPPQPPDDRRVALGAHTDFGSVTLLFNRVGGLQVYPPPGVTDVSGRVTSDWMYVRPLPGHCIVNLGDALVKFSAGLLRSATHRVISPPGAQASATRTSVVYFARPEDHVVLKALGGRGSAVIDRAVAEREAAGEVEEDVSSKEWILRRALGRRGVGEFKKAMGTEIPGSRQY